MIYPTEVVMQQIRQDMEREVAKHNLIQLAREGQPTLWQRLSARLSPHLTIEPVCPAPEEQPLPRKGVVALSH